MGRDGRIVADAILWGAKPSADGMLDCSGASLWSYFSRRYITADRLYPDVDQVTIAQDLIAWAQGARDRPPTET